MSNEIGKKYDIYIEDNYANKTYTFVDNPVHYVSSVFSKQLRDECIQVDDIETDTHWFYHPMSHVYIKISPHEEDVKKDVKEDDSDWIYKNWITLV